MNKIIVLLIVLLFVYSCDKEEEINHDRLAKLYFSTDTLNFDTIFTEMGSATKKLKVYNRYNKKLLISRISLADKTKNYRLNIDGMPANEVGNVEIAANDSIYIFVEITAKPTQNDEPVIIQDSINFELNGNKQDVDLIAYAQDVEIIEGGEIENMVLKKGKPYLILADVKLKKGNTLTIEAGTKLHFTKKASLIIRGKLIVNGTKEEPVIFQGDRLEYMYFDIASQWKGISFENSEKSIINYADIRNAVNGIRFNGIDNNSELIISNSVIQHHSAAGLYCLNGNIKASNSIFSDCGMQSVKIEAGGNYSFYNCTVVNFWGCVSCGIRTAPALSLSNFYFDIESGKQIENNLEKALFHNCIVYGNNIKEIEFKEDKNTAFNYKFINCLLKIKKDRVNNNFINTIDTNSFRFYDEDNYDFRLKKESEVIGKGDVEIVRQNKLMLEYDINGINRLSDGKVDVGAYEWVEIEEDKEKEN